MIRVVALVLVAATLVAAGGGDLALPGSVDAVGPWLDDRDPAVAAVALLRVLALGATAWVAALLAIAQLARAVGALRVAALAERALPTRLRAAAVASVVAVAAAPAAAAAQGPTSGDGTATMSVLVDPPPTTTTTAAPPATAPAPAPAPAVPAPVPPPAADEWVVEAGDSFWSVAEEAVGEALGRPASDAEVAPYWRALIEANRDRLVSANPDLVLPGQVLRLPPVTEPA